MQSAKAAPARSSWSGLRRICHVLSAWYSALAPGERVTQEIVDYIIFAKERGCSVQGTEDPDVNFINVIKEV